MGSPLYLDSAAVLRMVLESGTSPAIEARIRGATALLTSRLSLVESSRAIARLRAQGTISEAVLADADRALETLWPRCEIWEIDESVCTLARTISPATGLRTLDALHLATFQLARRRLEGLKMLTADSRLQASVGTD